MRRPVQCCQRSYKCHFFRSQSPARRTRVHGGYEATQGGRRKLTVSRPRLMVPTNFEIEIVRDIVMLAKLVRASRVDGEAISSRYDTEPEQWSDLKWA